MNEKIPSVVVFGRINHDLIYIEGKKSGTYRINEDFGGPAAYSSIAAAAQGERVGLVSFAGDDFLTEPLYSEIASNPKIDIAGVKFVHSKMPELRVWYPNDERKLTIGMIWDNNPAIEYESIPHIYLKAKLFLFMPMINELSAKTMAKIACKNPTALKFIDMQGKVRYLADAKKASSKDWLGMPKTLVAEWLSKPNAKRVYYDRCKELEEVLKYADIIKANEGELSILTGLPTTAADIATERENITKGVEKLLHSAKAAGNPDLIVTVTLGSKGACVSVDENGKKNIEFIEAVRARKDVINPTGAGDTYSVAFLIAHSRCKDAIIATKYALAASSLGVEKEGPRERPPKEDIYYRMIEYYGIK